MVALGRFSHNRRSPRTDEDLSTALVGNLEGNDPRDHLRRTGVQFHLQGIAVNNMMGSEIFPTVEILLFIVLLFFIVQLRLRLPPRGGGHNPPKPQKGSVPSLPKGMQSPKILPDINLPTAVARNLEGACPQTPVESRPAIIDLQRIRTTRHIQSVSHVLGTYAHCHHTIRPQSFFHRNRQL